MAKKGAAKGTRGFEADNDDIGQAPVADVKSDLDEMFAGLGDAPGKVEVVEEEEKEEVVEDDLDMVDEKEEKEVVVEVEEEEKEEESEKEEKEEEKDVDELASMRQDFANFATAQLKNANITPDDSLSKGILPEAVALEAEVKVEKQSVLEPVKPPKIEFKPVELTDELFEEIKDDKTKFAEFINKNNQQIAARVKEEVLLESMPANQKFVQQYVTAVTAVNEFYEGNKELKPYRAVVGFISTQLQQQNPEWNREKIIEESGKEAYRLLRLEKGKQPPVNGATPTAKSKTPAFAKTGTRRGKPGEKVYKNQMQKEMADMIPKQR